MPDYMSTLKAHYRAEIARFRLKPWDKAPVFVDPDNPPAESDRSPHAESWRRAAVLRAEMLATDPAHYDDLAACEPLDAGGVPALAGIFPALGARRPRTSTLKRKAAKP